MTFNVLPHEWCLLCEDMFEKEIQRIRMACLIPCIFVEVISNSKQPGFQRIDRQGLPYGGTALLLQIIPGGLDTAGQAEVGGEQREARFYEGHQRIQLVKLL